MGAAGEGHGRLELVAGLVLLGNSLGDRGGLGAELVLLEGVGGGDGLPVGVQPGQDEHRHGLLAFADGAGGQQIGHRRQDVGPVDTAAGATQLEVVAGHGPGGLLLELNAGHALLGEEALLLGHDQGGGVGERDEAQVHAGGFRFAGGGLGGAGAQQAGHAAELNNHAGGGGQAGEQRGASGDGCHGNSTLWGAVRSGEDPCGRVRHRSQGPTGLTTTGRRQSEFSGWRTS